MFTISKLLGVLTAPVNMLLLLLLVITGLGFTRWCSAQRGFLVVLVAVLLVSAAVPWGMVLLSPLEDRFPSPSLPAQVDGVIVLGGVLDPVLSIDRRQVAANGAVERLTALVTLARRYPGARLVFSGGTGSVLWPELSEAPVARQFLAELGLEADRVAFETRSRNTYENALFTKAQVKPRAGETWLLVTSAMHMPRAVGCFAAVSWPVLAFPVDYQTTREHIAPAFNLATAFSTLENGLHEWAGLLYYRLRGWIPVLFPGP